MIIYHVNLNYHQIINQKSNKLLILIIISFVDINLQFNENMILIDFY